MTDSPDTQRPSVSITMSLVPSSPGELAPSADFKVEPNLDIDADGREAQRGWLVTHPEWSTNGWGEACWGEVATFPMDEHDVAQWVCDALNFRAAADDAACDALSRRKRAQQG